jgi:hypothetical protein
MIRAEEQRLVPSERWLNQIRIQDCDVSGRSCRHSQYRHSGTNVEDREQILGSVLDRRPPGRLHERRLDVAAPKIREPTDVEAALPKFALRGRTSAPQESWPSHPSVHRGPPPMKTGIFHQLPGRLPPSEPLGGVAACGWSDRMWGTRRFPVSCVVRRSRWLRPSTASVRARGSLEREVAR